MENAPATNKTAKPTRSNSSKTKKTKVTAKSTKAKASPSKRAKTTNPEPAGITQQQRQSMIQEMAYLIAERRGFAGGNPTNDWLLAENQVDSKLLARATEG